MSQSVLPEVIDTLVQYDYGYLGSQPYFSTIDPAQLSIDLAATAAATTQPDVALFIDDNGQLVNLSDLIDLNLLECNPDTGRFIREETETEQLNVAAEDDDDDYYVVIDSIDEDFTTSMQVCNIDSLEI